MGLELSAVRRRRGAGFSLVEAVLAALITVVVVLGVLPLFSRAVRSNLSGAESTSVSHMATARAEEFFQYPFDSENLTIPGGATEVAYDEVWTREDDGWIEGTLAEATSDGKTPLWSRRTVVRQYNVNDVLEGTFTPLDGNTPPGSVQLKEVQVEVASTRDGGPLGGGQALTVRLFKSQ